MAAPQERLQSILAQLEGAYKKSSAPPTPGPNSGEGLPNGMSEISKSITTEQPPATTPRMAQILAGLEGAYPSNYKMFESGPTAAPEEGKATLAGFLKNAGTATVQDLNTISSGISQGFAFLPDLAIKLTQRAAEKSWQEQHDQIFNGQIRSLAAKGIDSSKLPPKELIAAKARAYEELGPKDAYVNKWIGDKNLTWKIRNFLMKNAQDLAAAGIPVTENKVMEITRKTLSGVGEAAAVIPVYAAGGPWSMATIGTLKGIAETGTAQGAILGGIEGALTQGIIHGIGLLPSGVQLPAWFGLGVTTTPGDLQDRIVGGLTWSALGIGGQKGKEKVTLREFIERYPRWQKRVDDAAAVKVLQTVAPEVTPEIIASYGGGKALLDRVMANKDKFSAILEVFKKAGNDPKALEAMLNKPDMIPLFRDLMGVTETKPVALPAARPETIAAGSPARFQVTPEGEVMGMKFPEDVLIRLRYREQELGRRMTPDEAAAFLESLKPPAPAAAPVAAAKPTEAPKAKEAEKPAAPAKSDMEIQMMTAEDAAKADVDDFKRWANPRFRISYDPTNESDMAAYKDLVKALGLRGDGTILEDVSRRLKVPEKPPEGSTPQAPPAAPAPPALAAPITPPVPAPAAAKAPEAPKAQAAEPAKPETMPWELTLDQFRNAPEEWLREQDDWSTGMGDEAVREVYFGQLGTAIQEGIEIPKSVVVANAKWIKEFIEDPNNRITIDKRGEVGGKGGGGREGRPRSSSTPRPGKKPISTISGISTP